MNEGVNTILGLWSVPLNCSFTWQCSLGISVTGIVISHHIIGMTLLSCCWVTSRFRLSKHTLYKVFFYLKYYHFIIILFKPSWHSTAQTHTMPDLSLGVSIFMQWMSPYIPAVSPKINACLLHILISLWRSHYPPMPERTNTHTQRKQLAVFAFTPPWPFY